MKCDLCGEEMHMLLPDCSVGCTCGAENSVTIYWLDVNAARGDLLRVRFNMNFYTPDEWQRLLKLKAFL